MAHTHFCYVGGHHFSCSGTDCPCICGMTMEEGDHSDCPTELRACSEHESGITPSELEAVEEAGAVPIQFPTDIPEKLRSNVTGTNQYEGWCLFCGHGYAQYTPTLADEHFAYTCPNAPEELRETAKRRLSRRANKRTN